MPKVKLQDGSKGLVQSSGGGVFLDNNTQSLTAGAADAVTISATGGSIVVVTSADANNIVHLPDCSDGDLIGQMFVIHVAATGFELRGSAEETQLLNGATGGAAVELAVPAFTALLAINVSATLWALIGTGTPATAS
tara:strand:+ start:83 stop:493 length:411 start_codon:yes stop_codon:yes gene_type:complete